MALSIAVDPCIDMDKVSDKAWNGALEENVIAEDDMLADDLALVLLTHHWKLDTGQTFPSPFLIWSKQILNLYKCIPAEIEFLS